MLAAMVAALTIVSPNGQARATNAPGHSASFKNSIGMVEAGEAAAAHSRPSVQSQCQPRCQHRENCCPSTTLIPILSIELFRRFVVFDRRFVVPFLIAQRHTPFVAPVDPFRIAKDLPQDGTAFL